MSHFIVHLSTIRLVSFCWIPKCDIEKTCWCLKTRLNLRSIKQLFDPLFLHYIIPFVACKRHTISLPFGSQCVFTAYIPYISIYNMCLILYFWHVHTRTLQGDIRSIFFLLPYVSIWVRLQRSSYIHTVNVYSLSGTSWDAELLLLLGGSQDWKLEVCHRCF